MNSQFEEFRRARHLSMVPNNLPKEIEVTYQEVVEFRLAYFERVGRIHQAATRYQLSYPSFFMRFYRAAYLAKVYKLSHREFLEVVVSVYKAGNPRRNAPLLRDLINQRVVDALNKQVDEWLECMEIEGHYKRPPS
jgi:hypothetical protein